MSVRPCEGVEELSGAAAAGRKEEAEQLHCFCWFPELSNVSLGFHQSPSTDVGARRVEAEDS